MIFFTKMISLGWKSLKQCKRIWGAKSRLNGYSEKEGGVFVSTLVHQMDGSIIP